MNPPSDKLFELIKSMTKSEKRLFKLTSSFQAGDKNYMKVFDAIESQKVYDEAEVKKKLAGESFVNRFPPEKTNLYNLILKNLVKNRTNGTTANKLSDEVDKVEILFKKGLYKECTNFVNKALKEALKCEEFYFEQRLVNWQRILVEEQGEEDYGHLIEQEHRALEKLKNFADYELMYSKVLRVFKKSGFTRKQEELDQLTQWESEDLLKDDTWTYSTKARVVRLNTLGLINVIKREKHATNIYFTESMNLMEANEHIFKNSPELMIRPINNLLFSYIHLKDYEAFNGLVAKMERLLTTPQFSKPSSQVSLYSSMRLAQLVLCDELCEMDKAIAMVPDIEEKMELFGPLLGEEKRNLLNYNIAYSFYVVGEYKEANKWLNNILNANAIDLRNDIINYARLFSIIIHFDMGNFDLIKYMIKSTKRYFKNKSADRGFEYRLENLFLSHLNRLSNVTHDEAKYRSRLIDLKNDLAKVIFENDEIAALKYFDFIAWIESKLEDVSFLEKRKANMVAGISYW